MCKSINISKYLLILTIKKENKYDSAIENLNKYIA